MKACKIQINSLLLTFAGCLGLNTPALAEFELGGHANIVGSYGTPTNDILGFGVALRRPLGDGWFVGINLEHSPVFDFEVPARIVGIQSAGDGYGVYVLVRFAYREGGEGGAGVENKVGSGNR